MKTSGAVVAGALVLGLTGQPVASAADPTYTVSVLALGGFTQAYDISPNGRWVVGYSEQNGVSRAFRWSAAGTQWLALPPGAGHSDAFEVGDDGTVVGWASGCPQAVCFSAAVRWSPTGEPTVLGSGAAYALSRNGRLVGGGDTTAVIWSGAGAEAKAESGAVWAVADDGAAAGTAHAADGSDRPAWWPASGAAQLLPLPPGVTTGFASAMAGRTVVGYTGATVAVWQDGLLTPRLPTPPGAKGQPPTSSGRDVSAAGVVVGDANGRAARWSGGAYTDLNTVLPRKSSVLLVRANGISDDGSIVGWAKSNGASVAFVLRRTS